MSKDLIKKEFRGYLNLSNKDKEKYISLSYKIQESAITGIENYFSPATNGQEVINILLEQFRDLACSLSIDYMLSDNIAETSAAIVCGRMVIYKSAMSLVEAIKDKNPEEISNNILKKDNTEGEQYETEFLNYIRGFAKYWSSKIDENDLETTDDLSVIKYLLENYNA